MNHPVIDIPTATPDPASSAESALRRTAGWLGYAGLIPFVGLAALALTLSGDLQYQAREALIAYGAVIISFLGAWHWYACVDGRVREAVAAKMGFAVTPALLGWAALLVPQSWGMALVLTGLLLTCIADGRWQGAQDWYRTLRRRLTVVASASMTAAVFSLL
ncbi:MAG: DUF3429 domain-containing protein [Thiohalobacterales bacterium]|nr:DUF3429 domain-containing protein [Thiohalobacterales bacterium]